MLDAVANGTCPLADPACPVNFAFYPCIYDPTDVPDEVFGKTDTKVTGLG